MIKFNINLLLVALEQSIEALANREGLGYNFDLTLKPEKGDMFTHIPDTQRAGYLRYVSSVYRITFTNHRHTRGTFTIYLFIRNGRDSNGAYTRLSSIEMGYIDNKQFKSFFKQHFIGDINNNQIGMIDSLEFSSTLDMKQAARDVREILMHAIWTEVDAKIILPF